MPAKSGHREETSQHAERCTTKEDGGRSPRGEATQHGSPHPGQTGQMLGAPWRSRELAAQRRAKHTESVHERTNIRASMSFILFLLFVARLLLVLMKRLDRIEKEFQARQMGALVCLILILATFNESHGCAASHFLEWSTTG